MRFPSSSFSGSMESSALQTSVHRVSRSLTLLPRQRQASRLQVVGAAATPVERQQKQAPSKSTVKQNGSTPAQDTTSDALQDLEVDAVLAKELHENGESL